jgi:branched-chain amino acid transport system permease protein
MAHPENRMTFRNCCKGAINLGFMHLPKYRAWVIVISLIVCFATWFVIERTKLGSYLRAGTENPRLVQAFGVNVPLMITLTYGFGVALAASRRARGADYSRESQLMGANLIIVVFAVVVIGGMGSILGAIVTGLGLVWWKLVKSGACECAWQLIDDVPVLSDALDPLKALVSPEASAVVVFVIMSIVLLVRPAGLFGRER